MRILHRLANILLPAIAILVAFWLYHETINCHFGWEDTMLLGDAVKVLTKGNLKFIFTPWNGHYSRLFWQPTSVILFRFFGFNAAPFYILILWFHLLNIFITYKIAQKLTGSKFIAFFSSLLYGVYQINLEGVAWISSGLKDIAMTTFFLLAFFFFISYLDTKTKRGLTLLLSYFFFFLAFSSEFKAILIPLVFAVYELLNTKEILKGLPFRILKYVPYLLITLVLLLTFYYQTPKLFSGAKDWSFWLTFPAGLSFYLLPISRIFWLKIYGNAHGLTTNLTDEQYLKALGIAILGLLALAIILLRVRKEKNRSSILLFLLSGILINYLPVMLMVLSKYHTLWTAVTSHWRYFSLASPLSAILVASSITWVNEESYKIIKSFGKIFSVVAVIFKKPILPFLFFSLIIFFHIEFVRIILFNYHLKWKMPVKSVFAQIKKTYPVLLQETVFVFEGTDEETKYPFFQHRYLFENIFSLYANPNNPNYLAEQRSLPFNPGEGSDRTLKRLLYYTNIKDFLVGNHRHLFQEGDNINFISPTLIWSLPAYDRLFFGATYGYYDPDKVIDFKFLENGSVVNVTEDRKKELRAFLDYFCFDKGKKQCSPKSIKTVRDPMVKNTITSFSKTGKKIMEFLIDSPPGNLPKIDMIKVASNL